MSSGRSHVRFRNLLQLLANYDGLLPLHHYLQDQFRKHKEWGSSDRRFYREYLYAWMRLGQAFPVENHAERLLLTAFLKNDAEHFNAWLPQLADSNKSADKTSANALFPAYRAENVFPCSEQISNRLDYTALVQHLQQVLPVYARILPKADKGTMVLPPDAELLPGNALRLPPGTDLSNWIDDGFLQVQDLASQQVCQQLQPKPDDLCWDMCCGAGGKSLFLAEKLAPGNLYCSDSRNAILENMSARFAGAGFKQPWTATVDLATPIITSLTFGNGEQKLTVEHGAFDMIVADVPCSGSGTWSRNPENLCFFPSGGKSPEAYATLQQKLVRHAWPFLKSGGRLHYITCSVYATENEDNANLLCNELGGVQFEDTYAAGYTQASDTLYHAVWSKP